MPPRCPPKIDVVPPWCPLDAPLSCASEIGGPLAFSPRKKVAQKKVASCSKKKKGVHVDMDVLGDACWRPPPKITSRRTEPG